MTLRTELRWLETQSLMGIDMEDDNKPLPNPTRVDAVEHKSSDIVSLVDVDFADYRRRNDLRTVRKIVLSQLALLCGRKG